MKHIIYITIFLVFTNVVLAQEETKTKKDPNCCKNYLPAAGEIAFGIDALPYITFVGRMFTNDNNLNIQQTTLFGKYYLSTNTAIRFELFVNNTKDQNTRYVLDDSQILTDPNAQVEDLQILKINDYGLGVGYQKYKGEQRLRGFYGGMLSYYRSRIVEEYAWGNEMTTDNASPTSSDWSTAAITARLPNRNLYIDNNIEQSINLGAIAGFEWFVYPKVCVGGEAGLYCQYTWFSQADRKFEVVEQGVYKEKEEAMNPTANEFSLKTQVYNIGRVAGRIYFLFHF